ncbi:Cytochrome c oxidase subunit 6C-2, partial [Eumeta japonica]
MGVSPYHYNIQLMKTGHLLVKIFYCSERDVCDDTWKFDDRSVTVAQRERGGVRGMSRPVCATAIPKPIMRGLHAAQTRRNITVALVLAVSGGLSYRLLVAEPRKKAYRDFYRLSLYMAGEGTVAKIPKPVMRGLLHSQIKRNLIVAIGLAGFCGFMYKQLVANPRKQLYREFY